MILGSNDFLSRIPSLLQLDTKDSLSGKVFFKDILFYSKNNSYQARL